MFIRKWHPVESLDDPLQCRILVHFLIFGPITWVTWSGTPIDSSQTLAYVAVMAVIALLVYLPYAFRRTRRLSNKIVEYEGI